MRAYELIEADKKDDLALSRRDFLKAAPAVAVTIMSPIKIADAEFEPVFTQLQNFNEALKIAKILKIEINSEYSDDESIETYYVLHDENKIPVALLHADKYVSDPKSWPTIDIIYGYGRSQKGFGKCSGLPHIFKKALRKFAKKARLKLSGHLGEDQMLETHSINYLHQQIRWPGPIKEYLDVEEALGEWGYEDEGDGDYEFYKMMDQFKKINPSIEISNTIDVANFAKKMKNNVLLIQQIATLLLDRLSPEQEVQIMDFLNKIKQKLELKDAVETLENLAGKKEITYQQLEDLKQIETIDDVEKALK